MIKKKRNKIILAVFLLVFLLGVYFFWLSRSSDAGLPDNRIIKFNGIQLVMVYIPAGEFQMGSDEGWIDEKPVHRVKISRGFWMGRTEVTQGLWKAVMKNNPSGFPKADNYPVETVSWKDCQNFIVKLSELTKIQFRLPTEAEWEYACRAGTRTDYPENLSDFAWYDQNSRQSTHPVGIKKSNGFGLYDMLGNVWEWCADWHDKRYYTRSPLKDPPGPVTGIHRVDRGGGWAYDADVVRPARRDGSGPDYATDLIGFRLASDFIPKKSPANE
jgi:formylglycine-generating enzyme required for sulfatase activity